MKTTFTKKFPRYLTYAFLTALICFSAAACSDDDVKIETPFLVLDPSPSDIHLTAIATEKYVYTVITNQPSWNAVSDKEWCQILPTRDGDGFAIFARANGGPVPEPATVTVTAGAAQPVTITVTQDNYVYFNTSPTTRSVTFIAKPKSDDVVNYIVATNQGEWNVASDQSWCMVNKTADGRGFEITAPENTDWISPEEATVTITCGDLTPIEISVKQKPKVQMFAVGDYYCYSYTGRYAYHDPLMTIKWDDVNNRWLEWDTENFEWIVSDREPEGVVCWLDETSEDYDSETKTGLVGYSLGFVEVDDLDIARTGLNTYSQTNGRTSGSSNALYVGFVADLALNYPAFHWARENYPRGSNSSQVWCIPAYDEWQTLYDDYNANKAIIEPVLTAYGSPLLSGTYWTATGDDNEEPYETFWSFDFDTASYANILRTTPGVKTRPICKFSVTVYTTN